MHGRALALGVVALFALPAGDALAGSASVQQGTLVFAPGKAERNLVTVTRAGTSLRVVDTGAPISPGAGCAPGASANELFCGAAGVTALTLGGGDGDDVLRADAPLPALLGGGSEDDILIGGSAVDTLNGGQGADRLDGRGAGDVLEGGAGTDVADYRTRSEDLHVSLDGVADDGSSSGHGEGDDVRATIEDVVAGGGDDVLEGSAAGNQLSGAGGDDTLDGRLGPDVLRGGQGRDAVSYANHTAPVIADLDGVADDGAAGEGDTVGADVEDLGGGGGADTLTGGDGPNRLEGRLGEDALHGGDGDDLLDGGSNADVIDGEGGTDTATYAGRTVAIGVKLDGLANDGVLLGEGDNVLTENATGGEAADRMFAGPAPARFDGGPGDDLLVGGGFADVLSGDDGKDVVRGVLGADTVRGGADDDRVFGEDGDDLVEGGDGADEFSGGNGDDTLLGGAGADTFQLGIADFADTNDGADLVRGGDGGDTADYSNAHIPLDVRLDDLPGDGKAGEGDDVGADVEAVVGGTAGDVLIGSAGDNVLDGRKGEDSLDGRSGSDELFGGDDADDLFAIDGTHDELSCGTGVDTFSADPPSVDTVGADCLP